MAQVSTGDVKIDERTTAEIAYRDGASFATVLMLLTPADVRGQLVQGQRCRHGHFHESTEQIPPQRCPECRFEFVTGYSRRVHSDWLYEFRKDARIALDFLTDE